MKREKLNHLRAMYGLANSNPTASSSQAQPNLQEYDSEEELDLEAEELYEWTLNVANDDDL